MKRTAIGLGLAAASVPVLGGDGGGWRLIARMTQSTPEEGAVFGDAVVVTPGGVYCGAPRAGQHSTGVVGVFDRSGAPAMELAAGIDPINEDFGGAIAAWDDRLLVGAYRADQPSDMYGAGAAYMLDASTGGVAHTLAPSEPVRYGHFGFSVALSDRFAVVGAIDDDELGESSGAVYVFDAASGEELYKLTEPDGGVHNQFGWSIACTDEYLAVTSFPRDGGFPTARVSVFRVDTGDLLYRVPHTPQNDGFGWSLATDAGRLAVGCLGCGDTRGGQAFVHDLATGELLTTMDAPWVGSSGFGSSIAMHGDRVVVGVPQMYAEPLHAFHAGSVCVFDASIGELVQTLWPASTGNSQAFGESVSMSDGVIAVGAPGDSSLEPYAGTAYLFARVDDTRCPADFNGDGTLDAIDPLSFFNAMISELRDADLVAPSGVFNFFDMAAYIDLYNDGCP